MKIRLLSLTLICALATVPGLRAQDDTPKKMAPKEPQTELGGKMEKISGAYRKLGRQIADATKNEDSLKQVAIIRENAEAALKLEPAWKAEKPADQQAKFVADYQTQMKKFIADVGKLEDALKAGNNEEAANVLKTLKTDQDDGHTDFRKKKQKKM
jgi:cytochrome c556